MDPSITKFFEQLRAAKTEAERAILQARLEVAQQIVDKVQDNIKKTFGSNQSTGVGGGGAPRSPMTLAAYGNRAKSQGRGGGLFGSVAMESNGDSITVSVGGAGVPYAAIHEQGGTIVPKNAKFLTIPVHPDAAGRAASEMDLEYDHDWKWGLALTSRSTGEVMFALRKRATIPARPYFEPAVKEVMATAEQSVSAAMKKAVSGLEVELK